VTTTFLASPVYSWFHRSPAPPHSSLIGSLVSTAHHYYSSVPLRRFDLRATHRRAPDWRYSYATCGSLCRACYRCSGTYPQFVLPLAAQPAHCRPPARSRRERQRPGRRPPPCPLSSALVLPRMLLRCMLSIRPLYVFRSERCRFLGNARPRPLAEFFCLFSHCVVYHVSYRN
jgi:hypothetical protein